MRVFVETARTVIWFGVATSGPSTRTVNVALDESALVTVIAPNGRADWQDTAEKVAVVWPLLVCPTLA